MNTLPRDYVAKGQEPDRSAESRDVLPLRSFGIDFCDSGHRYSRRPVISGFVSNRERGSRGVTDCVVNKRKKILLLLKMSETGDYSKALLRREMVYHRDGYSVPFDPRKIVYCGEIRMTELVEDVAVNG